MEAKNLIPSEAVPIVKVKTVEDDYGACIPDEAIMRFAQFLLPRMQEDINSAHLKAEREADMITKKEVQE